MPELRTDSAPLSEKSIRELFEWIIVQEVSKPEGEANHFLIAFANALRMAPAEDFSIVRGPALILIAKYKLWQRESKPKSVVHNFPQRMA